MRLPRRRWLDMTTEEFLGSDTASWIAVLPLAAIEQHGPHLPLSTDVTIAEAYLARVRDRLPDDIPATFLPVQGIGLSTEHLSFPGTLTLSTETALKLWTEIGDSIARAGVRKLVMVTSHGGNSAAMGLVAQELRVRHRMLVVTTGWARFGVPDGLFAADELRHGIHGGATETSIMLAHAPELVRADRVANFRPASVAMEQTYRWLSAQRPAPFAWAAEDLHPSGAIGDASAATAEKGRLLLDHGAGAFCELLADMHRFDLAALSTKPSA